MRHFGVHYKGIRDETPPQISQELGQKPSTTMDSGDEIICHRLSTKETQGNARWLAFKKQRAFSFNKDEGLLGWNVTVYVLEHKE
jgi:hypothetical protein